MKPALSVVIAAYNAADTLGAQLDSLRGEEPRRPWEIVVADNGSTDDTARLVQQHARDWPELRLIDASADRGPAGARNIGAAHARSDLLAFCDADDVVQPGWVAAMMGALDEADIVSGVSRRRHYNATKDADPDLHWAWYTMPFLPQLPAAGAGNMGIRAALFRELGGFDRTLQVGEDLDLCWRAQLVGARIGLAAGAAVNVSNRDTFAGTFRQAFRYGRGNRQLRHNFADVIAAYRAGRLRAVTPPPLPDGSQPAASNERRRMPRPADLNTPLRAVGTALGERWGRIDRAHPRVAVPAGAK